MINKWRAWRELNPRPSASESWLKIVKFLTPIYPRVFVDKLEISFFVKISRLNRRLVAW